MTINEFSDLDYKEHLHILKLPSLAYHQLRELNKILPGKYDASGSFSLGI